MLIDPVANSAVTRDLRRSWWLFLVRGLFAIGLGVIAVALPGATLTALILLIGAYLLVDGVAAVVKAFRAIRSDSHWWVLLLEGALGIIAGVLVFAWPGLSLLSLALLIGYWAIFTGISALFASARLRIHVPGGWLYTAFAIISILFGVLVIVMPAAGLTYIVIMLSVYGFLAGIALITLAFRVRTLRA